MTLLIFYLLLALGVSFVCSVSEAVLLSIRPSYIATLERNGKAGAATLKKLRDNLDRPLAAILTANTIAHTVGAAGVGAQAVVVFGDAYLGIASAVLTLLILVLSEIIPKTLGATYWKQLAPSFGVFIDWLTRLLMPFVWLSQKLTRLMSPSGASAFTFSRDEMQAMAEIGAQEGLLDDKELKIVSNVMRLHHLSVRDIMTPRPVVFAVAGAMTVRDFFTKHAERPFSRILLFGRDREEMLGYALKSDMLWAQARDRFDAPLSEFMRELPVVPDAMTASKVFDRLLHERSHIALVVDEYGAMQGIVTLEDVMESLIGLEIMDESDRVEDMQKLAHRRWRERMAAIGIDPDSIES